TNLLASAGTLILNDPDVKTALGTQGASTVQSAAINSLLSTNGLIGGIGGQIGKDIIFGAVINALKTNTETNVLSSPSVV
ncbi:MAG TPA: type II secretion system protein GspD, partial [Parvularcula sp.]|nr:type II secretion system protein GspD [Parvularcula sp.]